MNLGIIGRLAVVMTFVIPCHAGDLPVFPKELAAVPASQFCKVVDGTTSKDGRFAAAFGDSSGEPVDWKGFEEEGGGYSMDTGDCSNFLADLKKDRVVAVLKGEHFGTRATYNHESYRAAWSDDGKYLIETQSWKWHTATATLHRLDANGAIVSSLDLLPLAGEQLRVVAERDHKVSRAKFEEKYGVSVSGATVDAAGKVSLETWADAGKSLEDPSVSLVIRFTARVDEQGRLAPADMAVTKTE